MEVTPEVDQICRKAAAAVGGGFLSVDLLEHPDGLLVNELNYTPEFHGFMDATGIPVADHVVDYVSEKESPGHRRKRPRSRRSNGSSPQ
jgi:[lysine-biosynthesis-protein LysW]--L-2-aminoadipate ligase